MFQDGNTPLSLAEEGGHKDIADWLTKVINTEKDLLNAVRNGKTLEAKALVNAGAYKNSRDKVCGIYITYMSSSLITSLLMYIYRPATHLCTWQLVRKILDQ